MIMIIFIIAMTIIAFVCSLINGIKNSDDRLVEAMLVNIIEMIMILNIGFTCIYYISIKSSKEVIPAIEVYRGNTDLKVSYIDSIPQDSIVVWKQ